MNNDSQEFLLAIEIHALALIEKSTSSKAHVVKNGERMHSPPRAPNTKWSIDDVEDYLQYNWGVSYLDADERFYKVYSECVQCYEVYRLSDFAYDTDGMIVYDKYQLPQTKLTTVKVVKEYYYE